MAKKKKSSEPTEDKHVKFVRVVTPRVKKALKAIGLISNQAGAAYAPKEDEVAHILTMLRVAVDDVEKAYATKGSKEIEFSLE